MESNDSPEVPDSGETSDIPGFPSGASRKGQDPPLNTVTQQWDTNGQRSGQTLTSLSDSVVCLIRIAYSRVLSDITYCPIPTSKSVCRTTVPMVDRSLHGKVDMGSPT